jgi:hypothetical protein
MGFFCLFLLIHMCIHISPICFYLRKKNLLYSLKPLTRFISHIFLPHIIILKHITLDKFTIYGVLWRNFQKNPFREQWVQLILTRPLQHIILWRQQNGPVGPTSTSVILLSLIAHFTFLALPHTVTQHWLSPFQGKKASRVTHVSVASCFSQLQRPDPPLLVLSLCVIVG